jgi:hypothetical protein
LISKIRKTPEQKIINKIKEPHNTGMKLHFGLQSAPCLKQQNTMDFIIAKEHFAQPNFP